MVCKSLFNLNIMIAIIAAVDRASCETALRVLGGRDARKHEFPFAVRLEKHCTQTVSDTIQLNYHQFCTGAALTPSWILTAAHCAGAHEYDAFLTSEPRKFARYNSYFPRDLGQLSPITKELTYPGYSSANIYKHDIALLLSDNIKVSQYGKISAVDFATIVGHEALVLGFGGTNATPTEKPLQVMPAMLAKCDERHHRVFGYLCVVPRCGLAAILCGGDSGGPVLHASGIVGVSSLSWGQCDEFGHTVHPEYAAGGISMVSPTVDWISNVMTNKSDKSS